MRLVICHKCGCNYTNGCPEHQADSAENPPQPEPEPVCAPPDEYDEGTYYGYP